MGGTIEEMDIEIEQKDKKMKFLENKIGLPDCKVNEEMSRLELNKISSNRKGDRIADRKTSSFNNHKYIGSKKQKN